MENDQQSKLFWHLVYNADSEQWNEDMLAHFTTKHLQALALMWGAPKSGTKATVIVRILATRQTRLKIARYKSDATATHELSSAYLKCDLKQMCREAGLWRSGNKVQLAATLLSWRNRCRINGAHILERIKREVAGSPRQLTLFNNPKG